MRKKHQNLLYIFSFIIFVLGCTSEDGAELTSKNQEKKSTVVEETSFAPLYLKVKLTEKEKLKSDLFGDGFEDLEYQEKYLKEREELLPMLKKMTIKKLLNNIETLPDGMFLRKGDFYSEEIINRGDAVIPELIEMVLDDKTISKVNVAEVFNYFIGDLAAWLIQDTTTKGFTLEQYFLDEYKEKLGGSPQSSVSYVGLPQTYIRFLLKSLKPEKSNKENRVKLYNYLTKWYAENYEVKR